MRSNGEGRHQTQREARQKRGRDQNPVQGVMNAVTNDDQDTGSGMAMVMVVMAVRVLVGMTVATMVVAVRRIGRTPVAPVIVAVGMRVPPKHELLDHEKDAKTRKQGDPDAVRTSGTDTLDSLW